MDTFVNLNYEINIQYDNITDQFMMFVIIVKQLTKVLFM